MSAHSPIPADPSLKGQDRFSALMLATSLLRIHAPNEAGVSEFLAKADVLIEPSFPPMKEARHG